MWNTNSNSIDLVFLGSNDDRLVENGLADQSWEQIVDLMSNHDIRKEKDGPCFLPIKMKPMEQWELTPPRKGYKPSYRNDKNVESISFAVLDLDKPGAKEKAEAAFSDFEYVIYSTHSYTAETPYKYRIVLKLDKPVPVENWPETFKDLICGIDADKVCGNLSRLYYLPSSSPDAGIAPFVKHNAGKPLTPEDIINNRKNYQKTLSGDDLEKFNRQRENNGGPSGKRHFSGRIIPLHESMKGNIDYTYDGMKKRHEKFIKELSFDDSRHNFAMRVVSSEVAKFGPNTDLQSLVQFLYRASEEFSSKSIYSGDTSSEIPELVESSFLKFAPDAVSSQVDFIEMINKEVAVAIIKGEESHITKKWTFPEDAVSKREHQSKIGSILSGSGRYSYASMKKRNIDLIRSLIETGEVDNFIANVMKKEISEADEATGVKYVAQFCLYCAKNYFEKCTTEISVGSKVESAVNNAISNIPKMLSVDFLGDKDKFQKNIHASFLIAKKSAGPENNWKFEQDLELGNVSALTR
jgi:hypothetical protein